MKSQISAWMLRWRRYLPGLWAFLFVLAVLILLVVLGWESDWMRVWHKSVPAAEGVPVVMQGSPLLKDFALTSGVEALPQTLERPLFVPTRRPPPPPPPPAPPKPVMTKGLFQLIGTLTTGERRFAYLRDIKSNKTMRVEQGGSVSGLKLAIVEPNRVTLTQYDDQEILELKVSRSSGAPSAPTLPGANPGMPGSVPMASQPNYPAPYPNPGVWQPGQLPPGMPNTYPGTPNQQPVPGEPVNRQPATPFGPR